MSHFPISSSLYIVMQLLVIFLLSSSSHLKVLIVALFFILFERISQNCGKALTDVFASIWFSNKRTPSFLNEGLKNEEPPFGKMACFHFDNQRLLNEAAKYASVSFADYVLKPVHEAHGVVKGSPFSLFIPLSYCYFP